MPPAIRTSPALLLAVALALPCASAVAQDGPYPTWDQVPLAWPEPGSPERLPFAALFARARTEGLHLGLFGSSLHSAPNGAGADYIPSLNYFLGVPFGKWPGSIVGWPSSYGGGVPPAAWLLRAGVQNQIDPPFGPEKLPPGWSAWTFDHRTAPTHGALFMFQHDGASVSDQAGLRFGTFFDTSSGVYATIYAATSPGSQEIRWETLPHDAPQPNYFLTPTQSGTTAMGLNAAQFNIRSQTIGPLNYNGRRYMQLRLQSAAEGHVTIVGCRFHAGPNATGITVTPLASGGYRAESILEEHAEMGDALLALNLDAAIIGYGINEIFSANETAAEFETDLRSLITAIRDWSNDPEFPIILLSDAYRDGGTAAQQEQYAMIPGVQLTIAQSLPNIVAINARRAMEEAGFNARNESLAGTTDRGVWTSGIAYNIGDRVQLHGSEVEHFLCTVAHTATANLRPGAGAGMNSWTRVRRHLASAWDPVHLSPYGQRRKAAVDAMLILGPPSAQGPAPCYANCDLSTTEPILNVDDFTCFINRFSAAMALPHIQQLQHYANCDGSTAAPVLNVDDFTCFINAFAAGCP